MSTVRRGCWLTSLFANWCPACSSAMLHLLSFTVHTGACAHAARCCSTPYAEARCPSLLFRGSMLNLKTTSN